MTKALMTIRRFLAHDDGATMVEYGLMLVLIAVVCLLGVTAVGTGTNSLYTSVSASL